MSIVLPILKILAIIYAVRWILGGSSGGAGSIFGSVFGALLGSARGPSSSGDGGYTPTSSHERPVDTYWGNTEQWEREPSARETPRDYGDEPY